MHGHDFSHYNSDKQYSYYSKNGDFIFHKMSEGATGVDAKFFARLQNTERNKPFACYHVICPKKNSVGTERMHIENVFDKARAIRKDIGIALDLENHPNYVPYNAGDEILNWIVTLVKGLNEKYEIPIIIYGGDLYPDKWYEAIKAVGGVFWICKWSNVKPKHQCDFWQYTSRYNNENLDADSSMAADDIIYKDMCFNIEYKEKLNEQLKQEEERKLEIINNAITIMANAVIEGRYGNGPERKDNIYNAIQNKVNDIVKGR